MAGITNLESAVLNAEEQKKLIYQKPDIIHELELEVRTGSPVDIDPLDMFNEGQ